MNLSLERDFASALTAELRESGRLIAVSGTSGSGKSMVALNLAFELASLGERVILVDADSYHPTVASQLGLVKPSPGVQAALRYARQSRLDDEELLRVSESVEFESFTLRVLTGISGSSRWTEFDEEGITGLASKLRESFSFVVVDLSSEFEQSLFSPGSATSRNFGNHKFFELADHRLLCFPADAVGLNRLMSLRRELRLEYHLVANRVRASVVGKNPERALRDAIYSLTKTPLSYALPDDSAAVDLAVLRGEPLCTSSKASRLREAIRQISLDLLDSPATRLHSREH